MVVIILKIFSLFVYLTGECIYFLIFKEKDFEQCESTSLKSRKSLEELLAP